MGFDGACWCLLAVFGVGCLMVLMVLVGGALILVVGVGYLMAVLMGFDGARWCLLAVC